MLCYKKDLLKLVIGQIGMTPLSFFFLQIVKKFLSSTRATLHVFLLVIHCNTAGGYFEIYIEVEGKGTKSQSQS